MDADMAQQAFNAGKESGRAEERQRIVGIIDARLMALEPNDADAADEMNGRVMELRHIRQLIGGSP